MKLSSFGYLLKQGWKNMAANSLMSFASIGVLTACLIITGIAALLSVNVNSIVNYLGDQNEIIVWVLEEVTPDQATVLEENIRRVPHVLEVEYVSKEAAFAEVQDMMSQYGDLLAGYDNIFPASFRVTVDDLAFLNQVDAQIKGLQGVDYTVPPTELAGVIITIQQAVSYGGFGLVIILALVAVIVISNTIRLTVFARRREISIMKYVGATNTFIRLPFFIEGMTVGALAGLLATGVVCGAYYLVYQYIMGSYNVWVMQITSNLYTLGQVWYWLLGGFVLFGILVGGLGTAFSVRKHLKV